MRNTLIAPVRGGRAIKYSPSQLRYLETQGADLYRHDSRNFRNVERYAGSSLVRGANYRNVERYTAAFPSNTNVFIPSHAATGGLMTGFSRNPKDFAFNKYVQIFEVNKNIGYYATWTSRQAARIHNNDLRDWEWKDGNDAPTGVDNLESFTYNKYETYRYAFPFTLGEMTIDVADWNVLQAHAAMAAQQCMTGRTAWGYNLWGTASNWGTHCANVDGTYGNLNGNAPILAAGQNWTNGTSTNPNIKKTLNRARKAINVDTLAVVRPEDLIIVMNPNTAMQSSESPEINDYVRNGPFSKANLRQSDEELNGEWGMPTTLYGSKVVIEDAVIDTALKGATDSDGYIVPDGVVGIFSRKGGLEGIGGGPAYSTLILFWYEDDMTVESLYDPNNRLTRGRVVSNFTVVVSNNNAGYLLNKALG
jgi:hypothetical protein